MSSGSEERFKKALQNLDRQLTLVSRLFWVVVALAVVIVVNPDFSKILDTQPEAPKTEIASTAAPSAPSEDVVNGIHVPSGLIADDGYELVMGTCGACHSLKLVTQNRATKQGWLDMIRWMQETQKLWDLGDNEEKILNYLAKNYAPENKGRRENLTNIDWYVLEN